MAMRRKVLAGVVAAVAVGGAGAGVAATQLTSSPSEESKAIIDDAAKSLGVEPSKLSDALKKAMTDRIDAAVKAGRLTKEEGEELKQRIRSDEFPLFGPPALGRGFPAPHPFFHGLDAAATYLGLSESALRSRLNSGKTLAQIAKDKGKSVDGLKSAMVDDMKQKLDDLVAAGRLSKSDEQRVLKDFESRIDHLVNAQLRLRLRDHVRPGFGFDRGFERHGPPPFLPDAAA
jgi:hypothetical protein